MNDCRQQDLWSQQAESEFLYQNAKLIDYNYVLTANKRVSFNKLDPKYNASQKLKVLTFEQIVQHLKKDIRSFDKTDYIVLKNLRKFVDSFKSLRYQAKQNQN